MEEAIVVALAALAAALVFAVQQGVEYRRVRRSELPSDAYRRQYRPPTQYPTARFPAAYAVSAMSCSDFSGAPAAIWQVQHHGDVKHLG